MLIEIKSIGISRISTARLDQVLYSKVQSNMGCSIPYLAQKIRCTQYGTVGRVNATVPYRTACYLHHHGNHGAKLT